MPVDGVEFHVREHRGSASFPPTMGSPVSSLAGRITNSIATALTLKETT